MINLGEDLEREILVRLPAKSLMRFKCVQRSWNLLIKSPSFVTAWNMHHHNDRRLMILHQRKLKPCITLLSCDDPTPTRTLIKSLFPSSRYRTRLLSYGRCNGVCCLHDLHADQLILWNPTTREIHTIPPPLFPYQPPFSPDGNYRVLPLFGFGADSNSTITVDFKVVHLHLYNYVNSDSIAQIFNLSTKSWTLIHCPDFPTDLFIKPGDPSKYNALVNNVYHWITEISDVSPHIILCFDFCSNKFDKLSAPISKFNTGFVWDEIAEINGSLAYVVGYEYDYPGRLGIWVMDQQGSWARKYSIGSIGPKVRIHGIWKDGDQVLGGKVGQLLKSYDHDGKLVRKFRIKVPDDGFDFRIHEYVPSIAPLSSVKMGSKSGTKGGVGQSSIGNKATANVTKMPNIPNKWRRYVCEYNPNCPYGKMPRLFSNDFYEAVPEKVLFCDPFNNEFEILLHKEKGHVLLIDGWHQIGKYYNLLEGGWIHLYYLYDSKFMMNVQHRWMEDVVYPQPARTFKLGLASSPIVVPDEDEDEPVVETNVGKDENHEYLMAPGRYRWFYIEYDPRVEYGKLPEIFTQEFFQNVERRVLFIDPCKNQIEANVSKKGNRLMFKDGWTMIGDVYNLQHGGWIRMYYKNPMEFNIEVLRRTLSSQVAYPQPPQIFKIPVLPKPVDVHGGDVQRGDVHAVADDDNGLPLDASSCENDDMPVEPNNGLDVLVELENGTNLPVESNNAFVEPGAIDNAHVVPVPLDDEEAVSVIGSRTLLICIPHKKQEVHFGG